MYFFYDIKENRVNKVFKICKKYLNHWQKSVFRGSITPSKILELENEIKTTIDINEDFVSIIKILNYQTIGETNLGTIEKNTEDIFL